MEDYKKSDFLNISKSIHAPPVKQLENLIARKVGTNLADLQNIHNIIKGYTLTAPASRRIGKLQFQFKKTLTVIEGGYFHEFSQMPVNAQNVIKALAFIVACFKYHGYCENEPEYPILSGRDVLEGHLGLYDENDEFVALGHSYDDDIYEPPLAIPKVATCFTGDIMVFPDYCEIAISNNDQKTLIALHQFLEEDMMLRKLSRGVD